MSAVDPFYGIPLGRAQSAQRAQARLIRGGAYTFACPFDTGRVHGPEDPRAVRRGDQVTDVETGERGTVVTDFGNGIIRVRWHERQWRERTARGGHRLAPLVTDIGAVRLCS